jgi:hypothetical protein
MWKVDTSKVVADEVWYHGYPTNWTQREGKGTHHELAHSARRSGPGDPIPRQFERCLVDKYCNIGKKRYSPGRVKL